MKAKILNSALIITSCMGYLEWGRDQAMFLLQIEIDVITKLFHDPLSVLHPFVLLPLGGQLILIFTLFQKKPSRLLTYLGLAGTGLLLLLVFFIGISGLHLYVTLSTLPFLITALLTIKHYRRNAFKTG